MINFDEEIKKFKPSLEIGDVEDASYSNEMQDIMDIMQQMNETQNPKKTE